MGTLLYASETWTTYVRHVQALNRFHQQCLRQILGIEWQSRTPDTDVLAMCGSPTIGARLMTNQMRWAGHLARMQDGRLPKLPKQLFEGTTWTKKEVSGCDQGQSKPHETWREEV